MADAGVTSPGGQAVSRTTASPKEQALLLGPRRSMVGVLTLAMPAAARPGAPTVVMLNAGIIHRVGPNRLHVDLARRLAALGFDVLRFDLSGIGDSDPREDGLAPFDGAMADIRDVMDWLEQARAVKQVVLIGLCSGADQGLVFAARDARVVGVVQLDPSVPRTSGYFVRHWSRRLLNAGTWKRALTGQYSLWQRLAGQLKPEAASHQPQDATLSLESAQVRSFLSEAYRQALAHGTRFLAVFAGTAGREYRLNYREQMLDAYPDVQFGERLRLEFFKGSDHTFTAEVHRNALIALICDWVVSLEKVRTSARGIMAVMLSVFAFFLVDG